MKTYPSISHKINYSDHVYVFDKLDGSNIRVEWTKKKGFDKFGSRHRLLGTDQNWPCDIPALFMSNYADALDEILRKQRWKKATAFYEFYGAGSFAGNHDGGNYRLTLIDMNPYKQGFMSPRDFDKTFDGLDTAKLLYVGTMNKEMEDQIREGTLPGMTFEGVVCKIASGKNAGKMFKIKSRLWIDKLKGRCGDDETLFNKLL